jgi:formate hydrogenlyase subunit 3/multisubunit Na+/H+ antiporter MnhD subunit
MANPPWTKHKENKAPKIAIPSVLTVFLFGFGGKAGFVPMTPWLAKLYLVSALRPYCRGWG